MHLEAIAALAPSHASQAVGPNVVGAVFTLVSEIHHDIPACAVQTEDMATNTHGNLVRRVEARSAELIEQRVRL